MAVVHGAVTGRFSAERARMPRLARNRRAVAGRLSVERTRMPRLARNRRAVAGRLHVASLATAPPSTAELR